VSAGSTQRDTEWEMRAWQGHRSSLSRACLLGRTHVNTRAIRPVRCGFGSGSANSSAGVSPNALLHEALLRKILGELEPLFFVGEAKKKEEM